MRVAITIDPRAPHRDWVRDSGAPGAPLLMRAWEFVVPRPAAASAAADRAKGPEGHAATGRLPRAAGRGGGAPVERGLAGASVSGGTGRASRRR